MNKFIPSTPTQRLEMITAKIKSTCAETGAMIPRGELCYIDRSNNNIFSLDSTAGRNAQYGYAEDLLQTEPEF